MSAKVVKLRGNRCQNPAHDASLREAAEARMGRVIEAFNDLEVEEQAIFAERIEAIFSAGMPIAPFLGIMREAKAWASFASRRELKAYAAAAFRAMRQTDQSAFLAWAGRKQA